MPPAQASSTLGRSSRPLKFFRSTRNIFGLRRTYYSTDVPSCDPEEFKTLVDLSTVPITVASDQTMAANQPYLPYPNRNSFLLGEWYWSDGVQKSQQSFKNLIDIVGDPSFDPSDIRITNWMSINTALGSSESEELRDGEWVDVDAGWNKSPIRISVPFHNGTINPGPQVYDGGYLYHRSLVDVIKERISDPHVAKNFHLEPYQLNWSPYPDSYEIPVYGELYTSPSFFQAHRALQDAPGEPNCDLQRVVVALMFWSDATHLTLFGAAKLWPLYLFFGNESKYFRCKPTKNLCCHVAYFQDVSKIQHSWDFQ